MVAWMPDSNVQTQRTMAGRTYQAGCMIEARRMMSMTSTVAAAPRNHWGSIPSP